MQHSAEPSKFRIETPDTFEAFGHLVNHLEIHGTDSATVKGLREISEREWNVMRQREVKDGSGKTAWTKKLIQDGIATVEGRKAPSSFKALFEQFEAKLETLLDKHSRDPARLAVFQSFVNGLPHSDSVLVDCLKATLQKLDVNLFSKLFLAEEGTGSVEERITSYLLSIKSSVDSANRAQTRDSSRFFDLALAHSSYSEEGIMVLIRSPSFDNNKAKTLKNEWCIVRSLRFASLAG
ncbi:hypothetical protein JCM3765_006896 [Sporobolomyces pararoseus]